MGGAATAVGIFYGDGVEVAEAFRTGSPLAGSTISSAFPISGTLNEKGQFTYSALLADGNQLVGRYTPDLHWRSSSSGSWDVRSNWTVGITPADVHDVLIDPNVDLTVIGPANDLAIRSLQIGGGAGQARLVLDGSELAVQQQLVVAENGMLAGSGEIKGASLIDGTLAPGLSAGNLSFQGLLSFSPTSMLAIELGGTATSEFDRITVLGDVQLDGLLSVDLINGFPLHDGDEFLIMDLTGDLTGQFFGLNEGDLVGRYGNQNLFVTYTGGNGNDIGLYAATAIPEPAAWLLIPLAAILGTCVRRRMSDRRRYVS